MLRKTAQHALDPVHRFLRAAPKAANAEHSSPTHPSDSTSHLSDPPDPTSHIPRGSQPPRPSTCSTEGASDAKEAYVSAQAASVRSAEAARQLTEARGGADSAAGLSGSCAVLQSDSATPAGSAVGAESWSADPSAREVSGQCELEDEASTLQQPTRSQQHQPTAAAAMYGRHTAAPSEELAARSSDVAEAAVGGEQTSAVSEQCSGNKHHGGNVGWEGGDVDEEVLNALPPELKHEVRVAILRGRANSGNHMVGLSHQGVGARGGRGSSVVKLKHGVKPGSRAGPDSQGAKRPAAITEFFRRQK